MKITHTVLILLLVPALSFAQSTNRAQLKSTLLNDTMTKLEVEPEIIETYEKIADDLQEELGEEIKAENLKTITVAMYGISRYDKDGTPLRGGLVGRKVLDIVAVDGTHDVILDKNRVYVRTPEKVIIKTIEGTVLAENFLAFNDWSRIATAANTQLDMRMNWKRGFTIGGEPQLISLDGKYLVMFFSEEKNWVIFMPGNEAKRLEL